MKIVHAVHHTCDPAWWHRVLPVLGFAATGHEDTWAGSGLLSIVQADQTEGEGRTRLEVLVPEEATHPRPATVQATDGTTITVGSAVGRGPTPTLDSGKVQVAVMPIWYGPDPGPAREILIGLGLDPRLSADAGTWCDFTADGGGQVAWHAAPSVALELSLEHAGDLDALVPALAEVGASATVVDEAYNRTLLVQTPDQTTLWVNGRQHDLYGYTRADGD